MPPRELANGQGYPFAKGEGLQEGEDLGGETG